MDLKSNDTVHRNTSICTSPALKPAGCYTPPWLTNQNCTTAVCPKNTGDLPSHDYHSFHMGNITPQTPVSWPQCNLESCHLSNCPFCLLHKLVHKFQHAFIHSRSIISAAPTSYPVKCYNTFSNFLVEILRLSIINIFILQRGQISMYLNMKSLLGTLSLLLSPLLILHLYNLVLHLN